VLERGVDGLAMAPEQAAGSTKGLCGSPSRRATSRSADPARLHGTEEVIEGAADETGTDTMTAEYTVLATQLGDPTVVRDAGSLVGLYFPHHPHMPDPATLGPADRPGIRGRRTAA
jgi:hypothetical protein